MGRNLFPQKKPKLTPEQVRDIRFRLAMGVKGVILAKEFGVSSAMITYIKQRRNWRDVK